jgi:hypothetical protein
MAAFETRLYVNVTDGVLASSETSLSGGVLPAFVYGDNLNLKVLLMRREGVAPNASPVIVNPTGLSLKVAIGARAASPSPVAIATSFTVNGNYFEGSLDLATTELSGAITNNTTVYFEIEVSESGYPKTVFSQLIRPVFQTIPTSAAAPIPADEYYSKAEARQVFVSKAGIAGELIRLVSPDGTKFRYLGVDDTGAPIDYIA